ncbi:MAG: hypothetical protein U0802_12695 [Candidatus Binatia bacterium]
MLAAVPLARGAEDPLPFMRPLSAGLWVAVFALLLAVGVGLWRSGLWAAPLAALPLAVTGRSTCGSCRAWRRRW